MKLTADDVECNLAVRHLPDGRTWLALAEEVCARRGAYLPDVIRPWRGSLSAIGARHEIWFELKKSLAQYSYQDIAGAFGREQSAVMHGALGHMRRAGIPVYAPVLVMPRLAKVGT